eukprot:8482498-Alexandrium_andersonii.AAC.1
MTHGKWLACGFRSACSKSRVRQRASPVPRKANKAGTAPWMLERAHSKPDGAATPIMLCLAARHSRAPQA